MRKFEFSRYIVAQIQNYFFLFLLCRLTGKGVSGSVSIDSCAVLQVVLFQKLKYYVHKNNSFTFVHF